MTVTKRPQAPSIRKDAASRENSRKLSQISIIAAAFVFGLIAALAGAILHARLHQQTQAAAPETVATIRQPEPPSTTPQTPAAPVEPQPDQQTSPDVRPANELGQPADEDADTSSDPYAAAPPSHVTFPQPKRENASPPPVISRPTAPVSTPTAPASTNQISPWEESKQVAKLPSAPSETPSPTGPTRTVRQVDRTVTIPQGTAIPIRLASTLGSDQSETGDTFSGTLSAPVVVDGITVAPSGSTVTGRIVEARKTPLLGGRAELILTLTAIGTADGRLTQISTIGQLVKGSKTTLFGRAKVVTGAAVGAVEGAVRGAAEGAGLSSGHDHGSEHTSSGKTVVLPAGTELQFALSAPVQISDLSGPSKNASAGN